MKWRSTGPQKLVSISGHKYSGAELSERLNTFLILKIKQIIDVEKYEMEIICGHESIELYFDQSKILNSDNILVPKY